MPSARQSMGATTDAVTKQQVLRFIERRFALADHDHDGSLDQNELALFTYSIVCAFNKAKSAHARSFADSLLNDRSVL